MHKHSASAFSYAAATCLATAPALPAIGQDMAPHIDIGVNPATGQLAFGFTGLEPGTPIVIDNFFNSLPGGGSGFTNIPFTSDQDIAFRSAPNSVAAGFRFDSFGTFGQPSPQIAAEAVELDPFFRAFAFPSNPVDAPGESLTLNVAGQSLDFHPTYLLATNDAGFIGRAEATFRFVPQTNTGVYSASDSFTLVFVGGGDFDDDARLTFDDETLLRSAINAGTNPPAFDLTGDALVDDDDLTFWFTELLGLPATLAGDYNADGFVSQSDLDLVLLNWGSTDTPDNFDLAGLPGGGPFDNLVSQNELDGVLLNWGNGTPPAPGSTTAIPEPTTALAILLGSPLMLARRRSAQNVSSNHATEPGV